MATKKRKLQSLVNLQGSPEWRREVSPIRAGILGHMDEAHQQAFLRPTHCQLWKDQAGKEPAAAAAELVETMDILRAAAHAAYDRLVVVAEQRGFTDDNPGSSMVQFVKYREDGARGGPRVDPVMNAEWEAYRAAQFAYWRFMRGRSEWAVWGERVGPL